MKLPKADLQDTHSGSSLCSRRPWPAMRAYTKPLLNLDGRLMSYLCGSEHVVEPSTTGQDGLPGIRITSKPIYLHQHDLLGSSPWESYVVNTNFQPLRPSLGTSALPTISAATGTKISISFPTRPRSTRVSRQQGPRTPQPVAHH